MISQTTLIHRRVRSEGYGLSQKHFTVTLGTVKQSFCQAKPRTVASASGVDVKEDHYTLTGV
jgi:hypothetical protein